MGGLAGQGPLEMWKLPSSEGRAHGWMRWPWKCIAQLSCFRDHSWLRMQAISLLAPQSYFCPGHTSNSCFPKPVTLQWIYRCRPIPADQNVLSGVLWLKDFPSAGPTCLQLHCSLKHFIHIVPSLPLPSRDVRTSPSLVSASFFFTGISPINFIHVVGGYILIYTYIRS